MNAMLTISIKLLVAVLLIIACIKVLVIGSDGKTILAAQNVLKAQETESAIKMLKLIDSKQSSINKLTNYCIKYEAVKPITLDSITYCRDTALNHLGLPNNLIELTSLSQQKLEVSCSDKALLLK